MTWDVRHDLHVLEEVIVRSVLPPETFSQFQAGRIREKVLRPFAQIVCSLADRYVQGASHAPLSKPQVDAYCLYYLPVNFIKAHFILKRLHKNLPCGRRLRVLDYGCGPGTLTLAALAIAGSNLDITLVDHSVTAVQKAGAMCTQYAKALNGAAPHSVRTAPRLAPLLPESLDLILCGNVFNEMKPAEVERSLTAFATSLVPHGVLMLIEPGMRENTRQLMHYRDFVMTNTPRLTPIFPCTHSKPCPMLVASHTDWCHGTVESGADSFFSSRLLPTMCKITGFNKHRLKYAAFAFQVDLSQSGGYRLLTPPTRTKRGYASLVCGADYFGELLITKDTASDVRDSFSKMGAFDVLTQLPKSI